MEAGQGDRGRTGLAVTCCVVMFLYSFYLGAISVLLPFIGKSFGLGPAVQGQLFPANFSGFVVCVLVCGYLSDRWGRKTVLLVGIAVYALGLALFAKSATFTLALLASTLVGAGSGAMEAVASALASDLYPDRRAFFLNVIQIAFGAGAAISPTLAHLLLTQGTDWRALYLGLAAANVVLWIVLSLQAIPRSTHGGESLDFTVLKSVFRQPVFWAVCAAQALYVGAEVTFFSWMPTYFRGRLPDGARWEGGIVTDFWIAMTIGRIATGGLLAKFSLTRLILLMAGGGAVCSALAIVWTAPPIVMVFVALTGLFFSGTFGVILAEAGERFPTVAGTVFGAVVASGGVGGSLIPWMAGALAATPLDWRGALAVVPVTALAIALIARWLEKAQLRQ